MNFARALPEILIRPGSILQRGTITRIIVTNAQRASAKRKSRKKFRNNANGSPSKNWKLIEDRLTRAVRAAKTRRKRVKK